jgi:hypothetical protein
MSTQLFPNDGAGSARGGGGVPRAGAGSIQLDSFLGGRGGKGGAGGRATGISFCGGGGVGNEGALREGAGSIQLDSFFGGAGGGAGGFAIGGDGGCAVETGGGATIRLPQRLQNAALSGFCVPQLTQNILAAFENR